MSLFLTQRVRPGRSIEAIDYEDARQQALSEQGLEVVGEHILTIQRRGFNENDADRILEALSEEGHEGIL